VWSAIYDRKKKGKGEETPASVWAVTVLPRHREERRAGAPLVGPLFRLVGREKRAFSDSPRDKRERKKKGAGLQAQHQTIPGRGREKRGGGRSASIGLWG